jgi:transcriptional regulator with XRE-family HTH domain
MPTIIPKVLITLRKKQNRSLEKLAELSRVSKGTINKIERGRRAEVRLTTAELLARTLQVPVEVLTGSISLDDPRINKRNLARSQSELSVVLDNRCRNALQLVAWRYQVPIEQILGLAPFLFHWAADQSLRSRAEAIKQIESKFDEIDAARKKLLPHIGFRIGQNMISENVIHVERESIAQRDLFGRVVEEDRDDLAIAIREEYDESEHNPFTGFLKQLAAGLSEQAEFEWMWAASTPYYEICRELAMKLVGDDQKAADAVLSGQAPLHELPQELKGKDKGSERAKWARAEAEKHPPLGLEDLLGERADA